MSEVSARVFETLDVPSPFARTASRPARFMFARLWPERIVLKGEESFANAGLRQYWLGAMIRGRRREAAADVVHRVSTEAGRAVTLSRGRGPYLAQVVQWRRHQRRTLRSNR
ncbi:MAG: hypothetical protein R2706_07575 [Acidimicrobiales bacterium]